MTRFQKSYAFGLFFVFVIASILSLSVTSNVVGTLAVVAVVGLVFLARLTMAGNMPTPNKDEDGK